jgi:hypothetical protein
MFGNENLTEYIQYRINETQEDFGGDAVTILLTKMILLVQV